MKTGASYYPELSFPARWTEDLTMAREQGLRAVRCGEFAWAKFSPEPDAWDTSWAVEFLDVASRLDIDVIWCTPSAIPPHYLFDRWPDLAAMNIDGRYMPRGVRRHYCPSHPGYLELAAETAGKLAQSLAKHPAVVGWQVDNEIAGDGFTCWCPRCGERFQDWLKEKFGTLEALNEAWQTALWSQRYTSWSQIQIPQPFFSISLTPALKLAWRQFRSDNWLKFYRRQAEALREGGAHPVTTNFYNLEWDVPFDRWAWRPYMDVIGLSNYAEDDATSRFDLALLRGWGDKALWVLEQRAGHGNAQNFYPDSLDRIEAHLRRCREAGADYAIYWHLRQHPQGPEQEHGAVVRHDGKPTRVAKAIREAIRATENVPAQPLDPTHALVFDFAQHWAQETRPQAAAVWDYRKTVEQDWFAALRRTQPGFVVSSWADAVSRAKTVYAPHFQMADDTHLDALRGLLNRGGTFITTADFGRLDFYNNVRQQKPLAALSGCGAIPEGEMLHLKTGFVLKGIVEGKHVHGSKFWFVPEEASGEVHLSDDGLRGPAFLEFRGNGRVIVLLTAFDLESLVELLPRLTASSGT